MQLRKSLPSSLDVPSTELRRSASHTAAGGSVAMARGAELTSRRSRSSIRSVSCCIGSDHVLPLTSGQHCLEQVDFVAARAGEPARDQNDQRERECAHGEHDGIRCAYAEQQRAVRS